jgi:hypothetical protein
MDNDHHTERDRCAGVALPRRSPWHAALFPARHMTLRGLLSIISAALLGLMISVHFERDLPECRDASVLCPPFTQVGKFSYNYPLRLPYSRADQDGKLTSTLELYENDRLLGPAHSGVFDIATNGSGRYIYVQGSVVSSLFFSASDNTDPNTNGRTYTVRDPNIVDPYFGK